MAHSGIGPILIVALVCAFEKIMNFDGGFGGGLGGWPGTSIGQDLGCLLNIIGFLLFLVAVLLLAQYVFG